MSKTNLTKVSSKKELLSSLGERLTLSNFDQLSTDQEESYSMCKLLNILADSDALSYPFELQHKDKPDFRLITDNKTIGIEVTGARSGNEFYFKDMLRKKMSEAMYMYSPNNFDPYAEMAPEEVVAYSSSLQPVDIQSDAIISAIPLMGDEPYRRCALYIQKAVEKKNNDYLKPEFEKFEENVVLILTMTPGMVAIDDIKKLTGLLKASLESFWLKDSRFDYVFILVHEKLIKITDTGIVVF